VRDIAASMAAVEQEKVEADLVTLFGPQPWPRRVRRAPLEIVFQAAPGGRTASQYRGIRRKGRMVVDHFPDWPTQ
jgi:hypothetical protein